MIKIVGIFMYLNNACINVCDVNRVLTSFEVPKMEVLYSYTSSNLVGNLSDSAWFSKKN